jgi:hypothetical protein
MSATAVFKQDGCKIDYTPAADLSPHHHPATQTSRAAKEPTPYYTLRQA